MLFVFGVMGVWTSPAAAVCLGLGCSLSRGPPVLGCVWGGGLPPSAPQQDVGHRPLLSPHHSSVGSLGVSPGCAGAAPLPVLLQTDGAM